MALTQKYWDTRMYPQLQVIHKMVVAGVPEYKIRSKLDIAKNNWNEAKTEGWGLDLIINDAKKERADKLREDAEVYITELPSRNELANAMMDRIRNGHATMSEIDRAWNRLFPEDNRWMNNEEKRTEILATQGVEGTATLESPVILYDIPEE